MAIDYESIGRRIKYYRQQKGLSQEELGRLVFNNTQHISNVENARRKPSLELIVEIANALGCSADDILTDSLTNSKSAAGADIFDILKDCNPDETKMLIRILSFMKALLAEFGV